MGKAKKILEKGKGVLHLAPTWVPRGFNEPGKRHRGAQWPQNRGDGGHELCGVR